MKEIKISELDVLHQYILELSCIVYLQNVIQYENYCMLDNVKEIWKEAKNYLIDKETEVVSMIIKLTQTPDSSFL